MGLRISLTLIFIWIAVCFRYLDAYVEALAGNYVSGTTGISDQASMNVASSAITHFEPQVALMCNTKQKFYNQHMDEKGRWVSDQDSKAVCSQDKLEILEYCRKVYPKRDITNIVESSHYFKIENWCRYGTKKCKGSHWVKPYRCLEGTFQSDALLVPEHCLFDHVHNQSKCLGFDDWNRTAAKSCNKRNMMIRSFAMLLPCGIDVFSGVEFVCCPTEQMVKVRKVTKPVVMDPIDITETKMAAKIEVDKKNVLKSKLNHLSKNKATSDESDEDDVDDSIYDDEEDDDDSDEETTLKATTSTTPISSTAANKKKEMKMKMLGPITTSTLSGKLIDDDDSDESSDEDDDSDEIAEKDEDLTADDSALQKLEFVATDAPATPDPYFSHYDARREHDEFKSAAHRIEDHHRGKVTKVMKDWSELEERYQDMKSNDPKGAETFKKKMTSRFQKTVAALEEEGAAEKKQLTQMHQQRVLSHINERKREAMECYTHALNSSPVKTHKVQKCMEKLFRALEKDRTHTVNHYRHLLATNYELALRDKQMTVDHLVDLDRMINQSLEMLDRYTEVTAKIKEDMLEFLAGVRTTESSSLLGMSREDELNLLEKYQSEVAAKQQERIRQKKLLKLQKEEEKQRKKDYFDEKKKVMANLKPSKLDRKFDPETMEDERLPEEINEEPVALPAISSTDNKANMVAAIADQQLDMKSVPTPAIQHFVRQDIKVAHAQANGIHHNEATFTIKKEALQWRKHHPVTSSFYIMVAFAGVALLTALVVGVAFIRRRSNRSPHTQGFVQVDQAITPEERHVSNMQVNGYENPTYKYFEVRE